MGYRIASFTVGVLLLSLTGCNSPQDPNSAYQSGRNAGVVEGRAIGYKDGYEKGVAEGFEKARPGTNNALSGSASAIYKVLVWGGALKISLSLGLAMFVLLGLGSNVEIAGKLLFAVLGSLLTILATMYLHISGAAESVLLLAAPSSLAGQLWWMFFSSVVMYWAMKGLYVLARSALLATKPWPVFDAWVVFILASILTLLVPVLIGVFNDVPDVTKYLASNLLSGALIGGIYYLAYGLLTHKFDADAAALMSKQEK